MIQRATVGITALVCAALIAASGANADTLSEISFNGGPFVSVCTSPSGTSCAGTASGSGVVVNILGVTSNAPGTVTGANLLSSVLSIQNTNTSGSVTLRFLDGVTNFFLPIGGPLDLFSHIGTTAPVGSSANLLAFTSSVDTANGQNTSPGTFNAPTLNPDLTSGSSSKDSDLLIASLAAPYSITERFDFTLGAGTTVNFSASTTLTPGPVIPLPAALPLFATGIGGLGLLGWRRKRKAQAV
jgi:hypothetical protein